MIYPESESDGLEPQAGEPGLDPAADYASVSLTHTLQHCVDKAQSLMFDDGVFQAAVHLDSDHGELSVIVSPRGDRRRAPEVTQVILEICKGSEVVFFRRLILSEDRGGRTFKGEVPAGAFDKKWAPRPSVQAHVLLVTNPSTIT